ncbi:DUF1642 domain-containing protein [Lacticaseibacillus chiayiensis]|uniref:DUF1642 domain-containing protein n=1 Tax=Lacticaseibacillus chiayiensis TaxID=2100821 RepID=UPI003C70BB35
MKPNEVKDTIVKAFMDFYEIDDVDQTTKKYHDSVMTFVNQVEAAVDALEQEPVEVSDEEAEMLNDLEQEEWLPARAITNFCDGRDGDSLNIRVQMEVRLMKAYIYGYTIRKEQQWYVRVPKTVNDWYVKIDEDEKTLMTNPGDIDKPYTKNHYTFTLADLHNYGLDGDQFEKVEVTDNAE